MAPAAPSAPALRRSLSALDAMQRGTAEEDLDDFGFEDMMPPQLELLDLSQKGDDFIWIYVGFMMFY